MVNEPERTITSERSAARDAGSEPAKRSLEHHAKAATDEVRERVGEATDKIRRRASDAAESQREQIADLSNDLGAAIRKAGQELHERGDERTGDWADALAEHLQRAGQYLRERDLRDMLREVRGFARRRPGLVVGGLFAAGIAASRFMKADRDDAESDALSEGEHERDEPRGGFEPDADEPRHVAPAPGAARPNVIPAQPRGNAPGLSPRKEEELP